MFTLRKGQGQNEECQGQSCGCQCEGFVPCEFCFNATQNPRTLWSMGWHVQNKNKNVYINSQPANIYNMSDLPQSKTSELIIQSWDVTDDFGWKKLFRNSGNQVNLCWVSDFEFVPDNEEPTLLVMHVADRHWKIFHFSFSFAPRMQVSLLGQFS